MKKCLLIILVICSVISLSIPVSAAGGMVTIPLDSSWASMLDGVSEEIGIDIPYEYIPDGSITVKLSLVTQHQILTSLTQHFNEYYSNKNINSDIKIITSDETVNTIETESYITEVRHNIDFTKLRIYSEGGEISFWDGLELLGLYAYSLVYQVLDGIPQEDTHLTIDLYDCETHLKLSSNDYEDLF